MKQYLDSKELKPGYYLDLTNGEFVHVSQTELPPLKPDYRLIRIPAVGLLVMAPLISLGYIIFLPFAGIASVAVYGSLKLKRTIMAAGHAHEEARQP